MKVFVAGGTGVIGHSLRINLAMGLDTLESFEGVLNDSFK